MRLLNLSAKQRAAKASPDDVTLVLISSAIFVGKAIRIFLWK